MNRLPSRTRPFQLVAWLVETLKQGEISLKRNAAENVHIRVENNKIDLDFLEVDALKLFLELEREVTNESLLKRLNALKNVAEEIRRTGYTVTISHKGRVMLTLGLEAKPMVSQMVTGTTAIEVGNLIELLELLSRTH